MITPFLRAMNFSMWRGGMEVKIYRYQKSTSDERKFDGIFTGKFSVKTHGRPSPVSYEETCRLFGYITTLYQLNNASSDTIL